MTAATTPVRVLLVDDHTLFRESLRRVLEAEGNFRVVAEASTMEEALACCDVPGAFDLGLIDFQLSASDSTRNGLALLRVLRRLQPGAAAILLTAGTGRAELREAVQTLGASVFLKSEPTADLFAAIARALEGGTWISTGVGQMLMDDPPAQVVPADARAFNTQELLVLAWITEGLSNKEIADRLSLSESSVKALLQKLFGKTAVRTRAQLVHYVFECGLQLP